MNSSTTIADAPGRQDVGSVVIAAPVRRSGALKLRPSIRDLLWNVAVRITDWVLRRWYDVREFTDDPTCLFRISRTSAPHEAELSDGTRIHAGETIGVLHIWNEQLPRFSLIGPDFRWAQLIRGRMLRSFRELARYLNEDPSWANIRGIHACATFGNRRRRAQIRRVAARFGVELIDVGGPKGWHALGEDMLIWAFARAFNPLALRRHCFRHDRTELWISRDRLLTLYH